MRNAGPKLFFKRLDPRFDHASNAKEPHPLRITSSRLSNEFVPMQNDTPRAPMMSWLPIARDFRGNLRAALDRASPAECLESLADLAALRIGFLETVQLDRAFGRLGLKEAPGFSPIRLALLTSSTVDHLPPAIRVAGLRRKLLIDVHAGAYGQYRQELLDPTSSLHQFAPQAVLFSLSAREAVAGVPLAATAAEVDETIGRFVGDLRSLWRKAREIGDATIIQQTFLNMSEPVFGGYDRIVPGAPARDRHAAQRSSVRGRGAGWRIVARYRARQRAGRD